MHSLPRLEIIDASGSVMRQFRFITHFSPSTALGCRISGETNAPGVVLQHADDIDKVRGEAVLLVPMRLAGNPAEIEVIMKRVAASSGAGQAQLLGVILEIDTMGRGYFPIVPSVAPSAASADQGDGGERPTAELAANEPMVFTCDRPTFAELAARSIVAATAAATVVADSPSGTIRIMYGSRHYVLEPCLPLSDGIMVNIDTVGSPRGVLLQIENASGHDTQLVRDLCSTAAQLGIGFRESASSGTDHSSFANAGVDAANLIQPDFAGGYHGPGDTADGVDPGRVAEVVRLVLAYIRTARTAPPD